MGYNHKLKVVCSLLRGIHAFHNYDDAITEIESKRDQRVIVSFVNLYAIQLALKDPQFLSCLLTSDVLLVDGIALKIISKLARIDIGINMNGTDFIPHFLHKNKDKKLAFYGATDKVQLALKDKTKNLNVITALNGFLSEKQYVGDSEVKSPEIIVLGMGMPKQEKLSFKITSNSTVFNGGAIIDYISETKKRAPKIAVKLKLEWLYRVIRQPKLYFNRYFEGFILMLTLIPALIFNSLKLEDN